MKTLLLPLLLLPFLLATVGCTTADDPPPQGTVGAVPEAGVGTFGGPGAIGGGGRKPALPTAPGPGI